MAAVKQQPLSVSEITAYIKRLLTRDDILSDVTVRGEISNFSAPSSGHYYFSLKDENSLLSAVCFRDAAGQLNFQPEDGMEVIAGGSVNVYEPHGRYQLIVRTMRKDGLGGLAQAFEELKEKLEKEGLFAEERKRPLPRFPRGIALVTSGTGAAVRDMITVLTSRFPLAAIKLIPTTVQGEEGAESIIRGLKIANNRPDADLIICGRGGGSLEDLWCFNEEAVARAVFASRLPVISAVGHETDVVLTDYVADKRAATPSHAGEIAVPDIVDLTQHLESLQQRAAGRLRDIASRMENLLSDAVASPVLRRPQMLIEGRMQRLDELQRTAVNGVTRAAERAQGRLNTAAGRLGALDPTAVVSRGYSITRRRRDGHVIRTVEQVQQGMGLEVTVSDGEFTATAGEPRLQFDRIVEEDK